MDGLNFFYTGSSAVGRALGSGLRCRGFKSRLPESCTEDALRPTGFEVEQLCCETGPKGNPARWKLTSSLRKPESCTGVAMRHALRPTSSG